jgi:hypothetical protein
MTKNINHFCQNYGRSMTNSLLQSYTKISPGNKVTLARINCRRMFSRHREMNEYCHWQAKIKIFQPS